MTFFLFLFPDQFVPPERQVESPFRLCIGDVFKGIGAGVSVMGTVQTGCVQTGDRVLVMPQTQGANVKAVLIDEMPVQYGFAGDNVTIVLTGIDHTNLAIGMRALLITLFCHHHYWIFFLVCFPDHHLHYIDISIIHENPCYLLSLHPFLHVVPSFD